MFCSECGRPAPSDELARFGDRLICMQCKPAYAQKLREGVPVGQAAVQFAGFWIRFVAYVIDAIILFVISTILQYAIIGSRAANPIPDTAHPEAHLGEMLAVMGMAYLIGMLAGATYESFFLYKLGATPGKLALSLRVERPGGGALTLGRAVGRYFSKLLSGFALMIGFLLAGFDSQKRALHDMICDTRVIHTR